MDIGKHLACINELYPHSTVITANQRLMAYLGQCYNHHYYQQNARVWLTLDVLPLSNWLNRCFEWIENPPTLLTDYQSQHLWQQIIARHSGDDQLLNLRQTANNAIQAWQYMHLWQIPWHIYHNLTNADHSAFYTWASEYKKICDNANYIDSAMLIQYLTGQLQNWQVKAPQHLILAGFDDVSPSLEYLLNALNELGSSVSTLLLDNAEPATMIKTGFDTREDEFNAMAVWAKNQLTEKPQKRIGCVVTNLESHRAQCENLLTWHLSYAGNRQSFQKETIQQLFNISLGQPLSEFPLIQTALYVLSLDPDCIDTEHFSVLLRTPFIRGGVSESGARAQLDQQIRLLNQQTTNINRILKLNNDAIDKEQYWACPLLQHSIKRWLQFRNGIKQPSSPTQWLERFQKLLEQWGWPGERTLDSEEYQQQQKWQQVLRQFASLTMVSDSMSDKTAFHKLEQTAGETIFQPQSSKASVQVLGPLEAAGMHFDAIWISGMESNEWPPASDPNPFIPVQAQRHYQTPHASAQRETAFCQRLISRYQHSAPFVVFSYIRQQNDVPFLPSPLIDDLTDKTDAVSANNNHKWPHWLHDNHALETLQEPLYVQVTNESMQPGGSEIFKHQAACPFRAFAYFRLHACSIETPTAGFDPKERGTLLHQTLAHFWEQIRDQNHLLTLTSERLTSIIDQAIQKAFGDQQSMKSGQSGLLAIEKARLKHLLFEWIELEKQRPYFKVEGNELQTKLTIGGMNIKLKLDRVDRLDNNEVWIIDYKTGKPDPNEWFGDLPTEPQLPLYHLSSEETVSALLYGQLKANDLKLKGYSRHEYNTGYVTPLSKAKHPEAYLNWDQQTISWRQTFESLAHQYLNGYAAVAPKDPPKTCQYCDLHALCRIHEKQQFQYQEI